MSTQSGQRDDDLNVAISRWPPAERVYGAKPVATVAE